ncbi:MAG: hypothetical protein KC656_21740 [Myxococcales bacterium]|nr:hypothetical protein [Myxococcales bacterium]MCB9664232.1 hypothetical protein [Alphaproteobacteria bacterium]
MPYPYAVHVVSAEVVHDIPERFGEAGLRELVEALDGEIGEDDDVWEALTRAFSALPAQELAERLLDLVLLQPPIPAGCEALVRAMEDPETPPWRTHEVAEDRVWLWYCHRLLHHAFPERFPAPSITCLGLEVTSLAGDATPPGPRTSAHDRTAFVAGLLGARGGDNPLQGGDLGDDWAYDAVWSVLVGERRKATPDELTELGATPQAAASGRCLVTRLRAWLPVTSLGDLHEGSRWRAEV